MRNPLVYWGGFNTAWQDDLTLRVLSRVLWGIWGAFFGWVIGWLTSIVLGNTMGVCIMLAIVVLSVLIMPNLGQRHPVNKVNFAWGKDYSWDEAPGRSLKAARRYWALDKADKAQFPANILDILANPDLSAGQRDTLVSKMNATMDDIRERDNARRVLRSRNIDITDVLERLEDQRRGLKVEANTYREFSESVPSLSDR